MIEEFSDASGLGPTGMMAMESPVGIIKAYHLALGSTALFLEYDRGAHLTAEAARAQDDPPWKLIWVVERDSNDAFVAASRAWFVVEIVHI